MIANNYQALKKNRDKQRKELEKISPEPAALSGELMPKVILNHDQRTLYQEGTMAWSRIAMATIINAAEELGWEKFVNILDEIQRPANYRRAMDLCDQYGLPKDPSSAFDLLMLWSKGCLFEYYKGHRWGLNGIKNAGGDIAYYCPQIEAVNDMGMLNRAGELSNWCEAYDNLIMQALCPNSYFTYLQCLGKKGESHCITYLKAEDNVKGDNYYQVVKNLQNERRANINEIVPRPFQFSEEYWSRFIEKLKMSPEYIARDGNFYKARIAIDNTIIAANAMGWEKFINLIAKEQSLGFEYNANKLKNFIAVTGEDLRTAGVLLGCAMYMMVYDNHSYICNGPDRIEGVGTQCKIIDNAKDLGLIDKVEDVSLWCDFYHNHTVHSVNPEYQLTFTHCLGRGDKYCRFVVK